MFSVHKFKVYVSVSSNIHADAALGCNCPLPRGAAFLSKLREVASLSSQLARSLARPIIFVFSYPKVTP